MSKSRKPAPKPVSKPTATTVASRLMDIPAWLLDAKRMSMALFVLAFALYANTLFHDFALDDGIVITDNMFTKQGVSGIGGILSKDTFFGFFKVEGKEALVSGGRYRPLTLVLFAFVYQVAGSAPFVFHLLTVLLFAATCVMLYRTLLLLFGQPDAPANANMSLLALLAAAIFTVHP
ncbi:MAG: hypothetical protein IT269_12755, partial [Saprospiraceae bacterium]|nr:hypothetical protein [Saprospiraceae bacterium]